MTGVSPDSNDGIDREAIARAVREEHRTEMRPKLELAAKWLDGARDNVAAARLLAAADLHHLAIYHAFQAMEMAAKCMRLVGATWGSLAHLTEEEIAGLFSRSAPEPSRVGSQEPTRAHDVAALLDLPWLKGPFKEFADKWLANVTEKLASSSAKPGNRANQATRYPDQWPADSTGPRGIFDELDSGSAIFAARMFVLEAEHRLGRQSQAISGEGKGGS